MTLLKWILRLLFDVLYVVVAIGIVLADMSLVVEPTSKWMAIPSLIALAYEWLLVALIVLTLIALVTRHKRIVAISVVVLLFSAVPISHTVSLRKTTPDHPTEHRLSVLTYNTLMLAHNNRTKTTRPLTLDMLNYIKQQDADIVMLQEFETIEGRKATENGFSLDEVKKTLGYPYSYIDYKRYKSKRKYGMAVFSKYPLIEKQTIHYESASNMSDVCLAVVETDTLLLVNNHLESIKLTDDNFDFSDRNSEQLKTKAHTIVGKMLHAYTYRSLQAKTVKQHIDQSPYKVIVCGDFNDTPVSYTYHRISRHLRDAHLAARPFSFGHSFYHGPLGIRIDYVLCSRSLYPTSATLDKVNFSDHYPLKVTIEW